MLANIVGKPKPGGSEEVAGENDDSESKLKASAASLLYRKPPSSHIVHNKFLIYVDASGAPQSGIDRLLQLDRYRAVRTDEQLDRD